MTLDNLQITRLAPSGEAWRKIDCLAGHITVLRSFDKQQLLLFRAALEGKQTAVPFSLVLDDKPYDPAHHYYVGFAESFSTGGESELTVTQYLQLFGEEQDNLDGLLKAYTLDTVAHSTCRHLTPSQERLVRLLGASAPRSRVVILNEPFEHVPDELREPLAERLSSYARKHRAIVVVLRLSHRPQCWVDNHVIIRAQLEKPAHMTVGGGTLGDPELYAEIQAALKSEDTSSVTIGVKRKLTRKRLAAYLGCWLTSILVPLYLLVKYVYRDPSDSLAYESTPLSSTGSPLTGVLDVEDSAKVVTAPQVENEELTTYPTGSQASKRLAGQQTEGPFSDSATTQSAQRTDRDEPDASFVTNRIKPHRDPPEETVKPRVSEAVRDVTAPKQAGGDAGAEPPQIANYQGTEDGLLVVFEGQFHEQDWQALQKSLMTVEGTLLKDEKRIHGFKLGEVPPKSILGIAGLKTGDIVRTVNGQPFPLNEQKVNQSFIDKWFEIEVMREGKVKRISVSVK